MAILNDLNINDTGNLTLPSGTVAQRPFTNRTVVPFTTIGSTTWTAPAGITEIEVLVVGGGGAGGTDNSGGGGAGGLIYKPKYPVVPGTTYTVTVGAGAPDNPTVNTRSTNGSNSVFDTLTALGGGAGGTGASEADSTGGDGGSGGGHASEGQRYDNSAARPGRGTLGQGHDGGWGWTSSSGGGGGGAGGSGKNGNAISFGGDGGPGIYFPQFAAYGDGGWFAGGGAGGNENSVGTPLARGGRGGGGNSNFSSGTAGLSDATANTGGGGGGGTYDGSNCRGGAGGSGIVLIAYSTDVSGLSPEGLTRVNTDTDIIETYKKNQWVPDQLSERIVQNGLLLHLDGRYFTTGSTWRDVTGSGHTATLQGGTTRVADAGGSFFIQRSSNSYISLSSSAAALVSGMTRGTLCFWCKSTAAAGTGFLPSWFGPSGDYLCIGNFTGGSSSESATMAPGVAAYYEKGHEFFKDGKWHNFVYVYGKAENSPYEHGLYIDGERVPLRYGSGSPTTTITFPSVTQWFIGNRTSDYAFEDMYVADVMMYRQPLESTEIRQNFQAQKYRFSSESAILSTKVYPSARAIKQENPDAKSGLYWIQAPGFEPQLLFCDMEYHGGGWMLVASSDARDTTIPGGTGRNTADYELDRPTPLVGSQGISPNGDYIIGRSIQTLPFDEARIWAFGRSSTNSTYNWFGNRGTQVVAIWNLESKGTSRLSEVQPRGVVTVYGSLSSSAAYFSIDGVKKDREDGGTYTANSNQSTVGGVGTQGASGDPTTGCYLGHGSGEGSFEGWYDAGNAAADCQGYTTWVR